jgi:protoheme IX farnesyltransferase
VANQSVTSSGRVGSRFVGLLATATMGVYLLLVAGATAAIIDAAAACSTWPGCHGQWLVPLSEPDLAVAWGHRVLAVVVGLAVAGSAILAWLRSPDRRVRLALGLAALLYPLQVAIGAVTATSGASTLLSAIHLAVGVGIFSGMVTALAWTLDRRPPEHPSTTAPPAGAAPGAAPRGSSGGAAPEGHPDPSTGIGATLSAYVRLTKPRLMWLLCLVAAAAMALAAGPTLDVRTVVLTLLGGVLAIGASGTFNNVLERDVDRKMARTADRPVATHQVPARNAMAFGAALGVASLVAFLSVNVLAAILGVTAILYYSVVYTLLLKPNTVQNTVVGGFAGSLPALIGWAAVTGEVGLPAMVLAGVIFLWTPAHFYNLALAYKEDYERGGFPMLPVVHGEVVTRKHILLYLGATLVGAAALSAVANLGALYAATTVGLGALFLWAVVRLHRERTERAAFRAFHASNAYLGALLVAIVLDSLLV